LEIRDNAVRRFGAVESRAHEEMTGHWVDEFLIAEYVIPSVEKHATDLVDQTLLVGTINA
jgi:hypothetical protein